MEGNCSDNFLEGVKRVEGRSLPHIILMRVHGFRLVRSLHAVAAEELSKTFYHLVIKVVGRTDIPKKREISRNDVVQTFTLK